MSNFDDNRDYYETIGVRPDSSAQDIAQAYRQLARQYHPDANPGDADAAARFKEINAAYQTLADPAKRAEYDAERAGHAQRGVDSAPYTPPGEPALVYYGSVRLNSLSGEEIQSALDELRSALTEAVSETADELRGALSDFAGELDAIARTGGDVSRYRPRPIGTHAASPKHGGRSKNKRR